MVHENIGVGRCFILGGPNIISVTSIASQSVTDVRIAFSPIGYVVRSTISMQSMLKLGGSGGMPPRKILKITCSKIDVGGILCKK